MSPQQTQERPPNRTPPPPPKGVSPAQLRSKLFPPTAPERPPERPRQTPPARPTDGPRLTRPARPTEPLPARPTDPLPTIPPERPAGRPLKSPPDLPPGRPQFNPPELSPKQIIPARPAEPPPTLSGSPPKRDPQTPTGRPFERALHTPTSSEGDFKKPPVRPKTFLQQLSPESTQQSPLEGTPFGGSQRPLSATPSTRQDAASSSSPTWQTEGQPGAVVPRDPSSYFKTTTVVNLTSVNFDQFIQRHEKALVMFFHSKERESILPSREFAKVSGIVNHFLPCAIVTIIFCIINVHQLYC